MNINPWKTRLIVCSIAAGLVSGFSACSSNKVRKAATVSAAGAATGAVVKNQAKKSAKNQVKPDIDVRDGKKNDAQSIRD